MVWGFFSDCIAGLIVSFCNFELPFLIFTISRSVYDTSSYAVPWPSFWNCNDYIRQKNRDLCCEDFISFKQSCVLKPGGLCVAEHHYISLSLPFVFDSRLLWFLNGGVCVKPSLSTSSRFAEGSFFFPGCVDALQTTLTGHLQSHNGVSQRGSTLVKAILVFESWKWRLEFIIHLRWEGPWDTVWEEASVVRSVVWCVCPFPMDT